MAVEDRVAFALMFLSDSKLHEYLKKLTLKLTDDGNLAGILITGESTEQEPSMSKPALTSSMFQGRVQRE